MEKTGGSRLLQMQAKFQQKQMQERELKIASLYEAQQARALDRVRYSPGNGISASPPPQPAPPVIHHPGKVRQMFEERRTKAGIDKSYPLQPIQNTERTPPRKSLPNGYSKVTSSTTKVTAEKRTTKTHTSVSSHNVKKQYSHKIDNIVNGSGDLNHNHEEDLHPVRHKPHSNGEVISTDETDKAVNNYLLENETFPEALEPIPTPRSPEPQEPKRPQRRSPVAKRTASPTKPKASPASTPPRKVTTERVVSENSKPRGPMQRTNNPAPKRSPVLSSSTTSKVRATLSASASATSGGGAGEGCAVCGRRFAADRLAKHQEICKKSNSKKRKPFDALKHRLAGTEAEPFLNKLRKSTVASSAPKVTAKPTNSSWRQKHEEFIQAIRAAKQVQAHLKSGGKLSDLPPPPPSENPDYVQCPHCNRRFNQSAAERHIPKCANYQFNKPKPSTRRR